MKIRAKKMKKFNPNVRNEEDNLSSITSELETVEIADNVFQ